jgi:hypothetical protein
MMANHNHHHCQHEMAWCRDCDTAYCKTCGNEYKPPCTQNHYPTIWNTSLARTDRTYYPWTGTSPTLCNAAPLVAHVNASTTDVQQQRALNAFASVSCTHGEN